MSVSQAIQAARQEIADRGSDAESRYRDLTYGVANGESFTGAEVLEILEAAGKGESELEHDVAAIDSVDRFVQMREEFDSLKESKRALVDEIDDLKEQAETLRGTLADRNEQLRVTSHRITQVRTRQQELLSQFPECAPEFGDAKQRWRYLATTVTNRSQQIGTMKQSLAAYRRRLQYLEKDQVADYSTSRTKEIDALAASIERREGELCELEQELEELVRSRDAAKTEFRTLG